MGQSVSKYFTLPVLPALPPPPPALPPLPPVNPVETHINDFFDNVVQCVNRRREVVLTSARDTKQEFEERKTYQQRSSKQLIIMKTGIENTIKENKLQDTQDTLLREVERKLEEVRALIEYSVIFRGNSVYLEQIIENLGEVVEEEQSGVPRYQDLRPIFAFGKEGKAPGRLWHPIGIAIDTNNHIYVVESVPIPTPFSRITVFSDSGLYIHSFTHILLLSPQAIAVYRNYIYVANVGGPAADALFCFKTEPQIHLFAFIGGEGKKDGEFDWPSQIAVSTNGDLYITDLNNHRIQVFNTNLQFVRKITHTSMHLPIDIKLAVNSIYVLCEVSPCIHVFSYAGEKIRSLITRGENMQVYMPSSLCIDSRENMIISDVREDNIKIFSKDGNLIHLLGETGHQVGKFRLPKGLAIIDKQKLIVVSQNTKFRIQIFSNK